MLGLPVVPAVTYGTYTLNYTVGEAYPLFFILGNGSYVTIDMISQRVYVALKSDVRLLQRTGSSIEASWYSVCAPVFLPGAACVNSWAAFPELHHWFPNR